MDVHILLVVYNYKMIIWIWQIIVKNVMNISDLLTIKSIKHVIAQKTTIWIIIYAIQYLDV